MQRVLEVRGAVHSCNAWCRPSRGRHADLSYQDPILGTELARLALLEGMFAAVGYRLVEMIAAPEAPPLTPEHAARIRVPPESLARMQAYRILWQEPCAEEEDDDDHDAPTTR